MRLIARWLARLGWLVLKAMMDRRRVASGQEAFACLWSFFRRFYFVFKLREHYFNPFGVPIENTMFVKIRRIVRSKYPDFRPEYEVVGSGTVAKLLEPGHRSILLTVHNDISTFSLEILQSRGGRCSLFSVLPSSNMLLNLLGGAADFRLIPPDQNALLTARRDMSAGRIVCCHPDMGERRAFKMSDRFHIKTGIFEFARKVDARVFYALAQVTDTGAIVVQFREPGYAHGTALAVDMAQDFTAFLRATTRNRQQWHVDRSAYAGSLGGLAGNP